jgi:hypothetical protein
MAETVRFFQADRNWNGNQLRDGLVTVEFDAPARDAGYAVIRLPNLSNYGVGDTLRVWFERFIGGQWVLAQGDGEPQPGTPSGVPTEPYEQYFFFAQQPVLYRCRLNAAVTGTVRCGVEIAYQLSPVG